jgi:hypothetical protein
MTAQQQKYETVNNIAVLFLASEYDRLFRDLTRPTSAARSNLVFFGRNSEPGIHELAGSPGLDLKFDPDLYAMFTRVLPSFWKRRSRVFGLLRERWFIGNEASGAYSSPLPKNGRSCIKLTMY